MENLTIMDSLIATISGLIVIFQFVKSSFFKKNGAIFNSKNNLNFPATALELYY